MTMQTVVILLIATVLMIVSSLTVIPLNKPCNEQEISSSETSCGQNAFCSSLTGKCECALGLALAPLTAKV